MERQGYSNTHTHAHKQIEFIKTLFFFSYSAPKKKKKTIIKRTSYALPFYQKHDPLQRVTREKDFINC